jgi:hypothetical protein
MLPTRGKTAFAILIIRTCQQTTTRSDGSGSLPSGRRLRTGAGSASTSVVSLKRADFVTPRATCTLAPGAEGAFPVIQPDLGRDGQSNAVVGAPGFYVSTTSTVTDLSLDAWDQSWYLDATEIPYAAWAGWMAHFGLQQGDFGLALRYNSEASSGYVYGDAGAGNVGEVSRALFETLAPGRDNEPRDFIFLAFPGSGTLKVSPAALINIQTRVNDRVRRLNAVPNNEALATFLSFGANLDKFKRFQARKLSDAEMVAADSRYPRAEFALRSCGFIPGGG